MWTKHGLIYASSKAQLPILDARDDVWRIYYTSRNDKNQNIGNYLEVEPGSPYIIINQKKNILLPGPEGDTDSAGVMPTAVYKNNLYYIGWTIRKDVPYFNYCSVARVSSHYRFKMYEKFTKLGPILSPDTIDKGYSGTINIVDLEDELIGYYLSCIGWVNDENGNLQPMYDIKIAISYDGIVWDKTGIIAIELIGEEAGISSASVVEIDGIFHMWFSVRHAYEFRTNKDRAYRIMHATSKDGYNWTRDDKFGIVPELEFEKTMCAYPNVTRYNDTLHMFYNGDGFGETGIAHATMDLKWISTQTDM
jgi:hypothetical protein